MKIYTTITFGVLLGVIHGLSQVSLSNTVVPSFSTGVISSETTSRTEVTEIINQSEYSTGYTYNVTGLNLNIPKNPGPNSNYTIVSQGEAFQFTESYYQPGLTTQTSIQRTTITDSTTITNSVFTQ